MNINNVFVWNARGLNDRARRNVVREFLIQERASMVCLQETKVADLNVTLMNEVAGADFDYCYLPAVGLSGGVATGLEARPVVWNLVVRSTIFCDCAPANCSH